MGTLTSETGNGLDGATPCSMWATVLPGLGWPPARIHLPVPLPGSHDLLLRVFACDVRELDGMLIDGLLTGARYPIIPGHGVVGEVVDVGHHVHGFSVGEGVGVSRLGWTCGKSQGVDYRFCAHLPSGQPVSALAPLMGGGATAYCALRVLGEAQRVGLCGSTGATRQAAQLAGLHGREALTLEGRSSMAADLDA